MRARLIRPVAAASVLAVAMVTASATAAPKPVCNLIEDAKGDTFALRSQDSAGVFGPQEDALDMVSGDLAIDKKTVTGVIRVAKLSKSAATSPLGLSYRLQFSLASETESNLYMSANLITGTESFAVGVRNALTNTTTKLADATGVFDVEKSEIRISAPVAAFKPAADLKPGKKLTFAGWDQTSSRPAGAVSVFADVARSDKNYVIGAKSCVVPGK